MHVSVGSPLNNRPLFISTPLSKSLKRHNSYKIVSCRASKCKEQDNQLNFHKMLSVDHRKNIASVDEIKKAYRKMALRYHPDVCDPSRRDECTKIFVELQASYRSLIDQVGLKEKQLPCREWESQLFELMTRRSQYRRAQKEESWGCRMRAQHRYT